VAKRTSTKQATELRSRPLCRRYFLVIHHSLTTQLRDGSLVRNEDLHWALGVLADGSFEVLGVWADPESSAWPSQEAIDGLKARGVESIGLVSAFGRDATFAMSPRRARTLHASEDVTRRLQRQASRAIRRRGPCTNISDATAFVWSALENAEKKIGAEMAATNLVGTGHQRSGTKRVKPKVFGL
jgi:hypothetical protein